jgi:hypothetical protein
VYIYPGYDYRHTHDAITTWIIPGAGPGLSVLINPGWVTRSKDGMTIRENTAQLTVTFPAFGNYYVGLYAEYLVARNPILELRAILVSDYNLWSNAEQNKFVTFCQVNIASTPVSQQMIFFDVMERPRNVLAPQYDLDTIAGSSVVRIVVNTTSFPTDPRPNEIVYVEAENAFYIYYLSAWKRVDNPMQGRAHFTTVGTIIALPDLALNRDYDVQVTPTSESNMHLGEYWVEKSLYDFVVHHSGNAEITSDPLHPGYIWFDWQIQI